MEENVWERRDEHVEQFASTKGGLATVGWSTDSKKFVWLASRYWSKAPEAGELEKLAEAGSSLGCGTVNTIEEAKLAALDHLDSLGAL